MDHQQLLRERRSIVDAMSNVRIEQSQTLRQVQVPDQTQKQATRFIKTAPNVVLVNDSAVYLRYEVLYSFSPGSSVGGVYELLARDAGDTSVREANEKFVAWQDAVKCLLRYALNLLLAPNRPEFQTIKVGTVRQILSRVLGLYGCDPGYRGRCGSTLVPPGYPRDGRRQPGDKASFW